MHSSAIFIYTKEISPLAPKDLRNKQLPVMTYNALWPCAGKTDGLTSWVPRAQPLWQILWLSSSARALGSARPRGTCLSRASCPDPSPFPACSLPRDTSATAFPLQPEPRWDILLKSFFRGCFQAYTYHIRFGLEGLQNALANLSISSADFQQGHALLVSLKKHRKTCAMGTRESIGASNLLQEPQKKNKTKTKTQTNNPQQNNMKQHRPFIFYPS